ncbi:MAG: hypothetical protein ACK4E3_06750 [Brevundimonas sp.]|jgi:hypothetical protein|uniref:hypothetical protein n=1 Tax=Brevundimonas sp. TaxID=1871086 RepID=UPI00391D7A0E
MSLAHTLIALALSLGFTLWCAWRESRPPDLIRGPRMLPYSLLMVLGLGLTVMLVIHLLNLAGLDTGQRTRIPGVG